MMKYTTEQVDGKPAAVFLFYVIILSILSISNRSIKSFFILGLF